MNKEIKNFHMSWDNHLRVKDKYSWQPIEVESMGKTISWKIEFNDGSVIEGSRDDQ